MGMPFTRISLAAALAALTLSGCAMSDDSAGRALVGSSTYTLYSCDDLATAIQARSTREGELKGLMAKADAGGNQFVSAIAYRPEYLEVHGELMALQRKADEKHCSNPPPPPSAPPRH